MVISDTRLVAQAAILVGAAQRRQPRFAHEVHPCSTRELSELLRRSGCVVHTLSARPGAMAFVVPPIAGYYHIGLKEDLDVDERQFALRHELSHVLNEDADEPTRMVDRGYLTQGERLADLFSLADLIPRMLIDVLKRRQRLTWGQVTEELTDEIRQRWGRQWPEARIDDRAKLRVRLYREHGI